jgi:hypothetical protein
MTLLASQGNPPYIHFYLKYYVKVSCILYGTLGQVALSLQKAMSAAANFCGKEHSEVEICMYVFIYVCMYVCMYVCA